MLLRYAHAIIHDKISKSNRSLNKHIYLIKRKLKKRDFVGIVGIVIVVLKSNSSTIMSNTGFTNRKMRSQFKDEHPFGKLFECSQHTKGIFG